jgi:hypothetical protein
MRRIMIVMVAFAAVGLWAGLAMAGEYHAGTTNVCYDCHTMHFSMEHGFGGATKPGTTPAPGGDWLSGSGPNIYLLKAPANQLCLACHDGQSFAPDVLGTNINTSPSQGRSAGALNDNALGGPYEPWKGHTLDSTTMPPGYDNAYRTTLGLSSYTATGLECIQCHLQHGSAANYRNLGPRNIAGGYVSYVLNTTNDSTKDVWINIPTGYVAGSGSAATFNPLFDSANIFYNRNDTTVGSVKTSNKMDTFCSSCHGAFHGGPGDPSIGGTTVAPLSEFIRHPTSQATLGTGSGHSQLSRFVANGTKVKVYTSNYTTFADASPGCVSCHKAHGNQNPFGLVFLNRNATSVGEQGGYATGQTENVAQGYRNLCGQCHSQGN